MSHRILYSTFVLVVLCLGSASPAFSETLPLSKAIELAVQHNPALANASLDSDIARYAARETKGFFGWTLGASIDWQSRPLREFGIDSQNRLTAAASLQKNLRSGGSISVRADSIYIDKTAGVALNHQQSLRLALTQPLWRGRGSDQAEAAWRQAKAAITQAEIAQYIQASNILLGVMTAYYELYYAQQQVRIQKSSLDLAKDRNKRTKSSIRAGAVASTEALAVEQVIATREQNLLLAELRINQQTVALSEEMGIYTQDLLSVEVEDIPPLEKTPITLEDILPLVKNNPDIRWAKAARNTQRIATTAARRNVAPKLDLSLEAGPSGTGATAKKALQNAAKFDDYVISGGLDFQHQIGQPAAKSRHRMESLQLQKRTLDIDILSRTLKNQLQTLVRSANIAQKRIALADKIIELVEKNVAAETTRFSLGRSTNFDVLQRQDELRTAQLGKARATTDYLLARANISQFTGALLASWGVSILSVQ